jgi:predicted Zn-dependent peptidase
LSEQNTEFMPMTHLRQSESRWTSWQLENGLQCLHVPLPEGDLRFQLTLLVGVGSRHERPDQSGISHLLEHLMFRGCAKYPSFSDLSCAFESLGGEWNAATGHEYTEFYFNGTTGKMSEAVALFADFILRPALSDLDTERRIVLRELEGELNEQGISTDADYHISTKIWPNSSMAMPIIGTPETLNGLKTADIRNWFQTWYTPQNAVICAVGGNYQKVRDLIQTHFGPWTIDSTQSRKKGLQTNYAGPRSFWVENSDSEYQIQLSFLCEGTGSERTATYELLTRILSDGFSSRLTKRIREELGLVYDISSDLHQYDGIGLFNITASVVGENIKQFFEEVFLVLATVVKQEIKGDELDRHKYRTLVDLSITTAEPSALAWRGSWAMLSKTEAKLSVWAEKISRLTPEDVAASATTIFAAEKLCVVAVGPDDFGLKDGLEDIVKQCWQRAWQTRTHVEERP